MDLDDDEDQVEVEYVTEDMEMTNPYFRSFSQIFEKFKVIIVFFFFVFFVFFCFFVFLFVCLFFFFCLKIQLLLQRQCSFSFISFQKKVWSCCE